MSVGCRFKAVVSLAWLLMVGLMACAPSRAATEDPVCGDGVIEGAEECDDGNTEPYDGCSPICQIQAISVCGNGVIEGGEECDDSNAYDGDGCSPTCQLERCGDGIVQDGLGEECDDGNNANGDGCSLTCLQEICGDGIHQAALGEECDDGNEVDGDGCATGCLLEYCGDGIVTAGQGEECDDGNTTDCDGCDASCLTEETPNCGDGNLDCGEQCDDGNTTDCDGCSATCVLETPTCGDGNTECGEECDDGNTDDGDGCSATCLTELCGDGVVQTALGETCDDAGESATCDTDCTAAVCGDGVTNVTAGEECDDGNSDPNDSCDSCTVTQCAGTDSLVSIYANNNGMDGNMFDVVLLQSVTIDSFDVNCDNTNDWEIYYKLGTWQGYQSDAAAWTLIGTASGVVCNAVDVPTPLNLDLNLTLAGGQTVAFYLVTVNGSINYTTGSAVGAVVSQNSHMQILEGWGGNYLFGSGFSPRIWNGTIIYCP